MLKPVLCGGEILLDSISKEVGKGLDHSVLFEKRPGGSIFNVVVGLRRLGGSISLLEKPASDAYLELLNMFYKEKVITSFDPNIRPSLIKDKKDFLNMFFKISKMVDILKMSDDDLKYITGLSDVKEGLRKILNKINSSLVLVTLGKSGVLSYYKGQFIHIPTFNKIRIKETTGCGDAFMAAIIYGLLKCENFLHLSTSKLVEILTFANGVATIVGTRYGASNSMPWLSEVKKFISLYQK